MITPLVVVGALTLVIGAYVFANARWEFEAAMRLSGVDPDSIDNRSRESGVRRNQIVAAVLFVLGLGVLGWGLAG